MHAVVVDSLEEFLAGSLEPVESRAVEAHLRECQACREEVRGMQEVSLLFSSLRSEEPVEPALGFYARVMQQVEGQKASPSVSRLFALDFTAGLRLAMASLLMLAVLGGYFISRESSFTPGPSPDAVMAQQNLPSFDSAPGPDNMLVTLTTYEH